MGSERCCAVQTLAVFGQYYTPCPGTQLALFESSSSRKLHSSLDAAGAHSSTTRRMPCALLHAAELEPTALRAASHANGTWWHGGLTGHS